VVTRVSNRDFFGYFDLWPQHVRETRRSLHMIDRSVELYSNA